MRRVLATGRDGVRRGRNRPGDAVAAKNQIIPSHRLTAIVAIAMVISYGVIAVLPDPLSA